MSSIFEQAIVDAEVLRAAAIVEKYSIDIKEAVDKLYGASF